MAQWKSFKDSRRHQQRQGDGGWAYAKDLFPTIQRLEVPGRGPDGLYRITVGLENGAEVMVRGVNLQGAWQALADAAEAMK